MKLYFLRHADAMDGLDDDARPLSPKGEQQVRELARFLLKAGTEFGAVFTSPLVRAKQTAEILLESMGAGIVAAETPALLNSTTQGAFDAWVHALPGHKRVLLVGHAPSLPERVCRLLGVQEREALRMPKGGLACIKTEDGITGRLKFFVTPKLLG